MDKERARDLKRSGSRSSPTKRQQRALSGHIIPSTNNITNSNSSNSNSKPLSSPSSPSGSNSNSNAKGGEGDAMERWKKERVKGLRWNSTNNGEDCGDSDGEDAYIFRPPINATSSSLSSRKRVKLRGKVSGDCNVVDPAIVPRRLRSAINKRSSQSASPPLPDSNKKQFHVPNGTQEFKAFGTGRFNEKMLHDPFTNDEKEVAQTLTALASLIPVCKPVNIKEDRRMSEENLERKGTYNSISEASEGEGSKFLLPSIGIEAINPSSLVKQSCEENMNTEAAVQEQPAAASVGEKFDVESSGTCQPNSQRTLLSNSNEKLENKTSSRDALNLSNPLGASPNFFPENGVSQTTQLDVLSVRKTDIGLWPSGTASVEYKMQSVKHKPDSSPHSMGREEKTSDKRPGLLNSTNGHLTMSFSSKPAACPDSAAAVIRHNSTRNDLLMAKLPTVTTGRKQPWKKCSTHVYISHLIQNYRGTERKQRPPLPANQSKNKNGTNSAVYTSNGTVAGSRNGMVPSLPNGSPMEKNIHEAGARVLRDGGLLQAQAYAQQKQGVDFLSLSTAGAGEALNPGNGAKLSVQPHVPYLHSQVPHHFPFPRGPPYTSSYPDQIAAAAAQQVQLQLPHYIGSSSPFYSGPPMSAAATKHQQQLWQAHMAQYRPMLGFPKWQQNGRQHHHQHHESSSSPSLLACTHSPSSFPVLPPGSEMRQGGTAYHPANNNPQQQLPLPMPSSSPSPSKSKQQQEQQHNNNGGGVGFSPDRLSQLQLLCNARHM